MSEGLKAYKIVAEECSFAFGQTANGDRVRENLPIIEKELKALELLLDKVLDKDGLDEYVDMFFEKCLINEEEYNLLKEVLK